MKLLNRRYWNSINWWNQMWLRIFLLTTSYPKLRMSTTNFYWRNTYSFGEIFHLKIDAENLIKEINSLPADLNKQALADAEAMLQYASQRTQNFILLDFDVKDKQSRSHTPKCFPYRIIRHKKQRTCYYSTGLILRSAYNWADCYRHCDQSGFWSVSTCTKG